EYSARSSAEGAVQQYHYSAIFPSMVNVRSVPTYFMGLVDGANLIKNYAFVSYENYQLVATGTTVEEAYRNYVKLINGDQPVEPVEIETSIVSFTVSDVMTIVQNGNSVVLLKDENGKIYSYDLSGGDFASVFTNVGDIVTVMADENGTITGFIR
ncbi:MAG: CvpA family protein, partial [Erysipelotrichaceae bacterium]|nr:CvpA family protein [Erysipelotrichaceae bacterium]